MRLTQPLCKHSLRWILKKQMKYKGRFWQPKTVIPKPLIEQGIEIVDPVEKYMRPKVEPWEPPVPDDPQFAPPPQISDHPDYHEEPVYNFTLKTRLMGGLDQACILTKTQPYEGLPQQISNLIGKVHIQDQDELIQRYIMQANVWDPTKDKLPKRFNTALPGWKFKREFGIPYSKIISVLMSNLVRLCSSLGGAYPELLTDRRHMYQHFTKTFYTYQGDKNIHLDTESEWFVSSNKPLRPYSTEEEIDSTVSYELPDMYPIAPTVDVKKGHVWKQENITGWREGSTHVYPHTVFLCNPDYWTTGQRNARALLTCFSHTIALAKQKYGWDAQTLPEPIPVQCVHTDGRVFHFVAFQLNTLNFSGSDGVKNQVWIDSDHAMFEKLIPKRAMLRNTKYEDYDPEVFQRLLALYLNGAGFAAKL